MGLIYIGVLNGGRRRMESRDQVMVLCDSSLHTNHYKFSDITAGKLSVKSQFITPKPWPQNGTSRTAGQIHFHPALCISLEDGRSAFCCSFFLTL